MKLIKVVKEIFKDIKEQTGGDRALWILIICLNMCSIVVIFSAIASLAYEGGDVNATKFLLKQTLLSCASIVIVYIVHLIDYDFYRKKSYHIMLFGLVLMFLTFVAGHEINGEKRWLLIPFTKSTFQPADVLKITIVTLLAAQLTNIQKRMDSFRFLPSFSKRKWRKQPRKNREILYKTTIPMLLPIVLGCSMVLYSNLSTAFIIATSCLIMMIIGRVPYKEIGKLVGVAASFVVVAIGLLYLLGVGRAETWANRVEKFITPKEVVYNSDGTVKPDSLDLNSQAVQAKIAVASGWITGKGPGKSIQRSNLPLPYSDFIFAFIAEEYGVWGALLIIGAYIWIFYRAIEIFRACDHVFPSMLVLGLSTMIMVQAMMHIAVSLDVWPTTGQPLPMMSKGGSSLIFTSVMFGMILGVSRQINNKKRLKQKSKEKQLVVEEWEQLVIEEEIESDETNDQYQDSVIIETFPNEFGGVVWDENRAKRDGK